MATRYTTTIEQFTDRKVVAFISRAHVDDDITMEVFLIDRPLNGFGAVEIVDANRAIRPQPDGTPASPPRRPICPARLARGRSG